MQKRHHLLILFFGVLGMLMGVGSAQAQGEEEALKARADKFWKARVQEDWATVYHFLFLEEKDKETQEQFVAFRKEKGPFRYLSAEVGKAAVAGEIGWVELSYAARPSAYPEVPPEQVAMWEPWRLQEGQWYPVPPQQWEQLPKRPPHLRPAEEEAALTQRAHEFWQAREGQDWALIYHYLDPDYRAKISEKKFLTKKSLFAYSDHRLDWVEVTGNQGRVKVTYFRKLNDPTLYKLKPKEDSMVEEWVKVDGTWYRRARQSDRSGS